MVFKFFFIYFLNLFNKFFLRHYPIGVLYDLYFDNNDNEFLPWLIIVKLKVFYK